MDYLKKVLPPNAFEAFLCGSNFAKTAFRLGEKQGRLVNDECSCCYNRVGNFKVSTWDRRKQVLYTNISAPLLQSEWSMALSAMTVECE